MVLPDTLARRVYGCLRTVTQPGKVTGARSCLRDLYIEPDDIPESSTRSHQAPIGFDGWTLPTGLRTPVSQVSLRLVGCALMGA